MMKLILKMVIWLSFCFEMSHGRKRWDLPNRSCKAKRACWLNPLQILLAALNQISANYNSSSLFFFWSRSLNCCRSRSQLSSCIPYWQNFHFTFKQPLVLHTVPLAYYTLLLLNRRSLIHSRFAAACRHLASPLGQKRVDAPIKRGCGIQDGTVWRARVLHPSI